MKSYSRLQVTRVEHLTGYLLQISFSNGIVRVVNLENELYGPIFEPLQDLTLFAQATISGGTVAWTNGADFAVEYLLALPELPAGDGNVKGTA